MCYSSLFVEVLSFVGWPSFSPTRKRGEGGKVDVVVTAEDAVHLSVVLVLREHRPDAMPATIFLEFQGNAAVSLVPSAATPVEVERFVRERDSRGITYGERAIAQVIGVVENRLEVGVRLDILGDAAVARVIPVDEDLERGVVGELKGDIWVIVRAAHALEDLPNELCWVDTYGSWGAGLFRCMPRLRPSRR